MTSSVLIDTGPLVAFLNRRDRFHDWTVKEMAQVEPPLFTCEAVVSEACFLLQRGAGNADPLLDLLDRGLIALEFRLAEERSNVRTLMNRYRDQGMSLADACLVRMSELVTNCTLLTLDSDFRIYRRSGRQVIPVRMPRELA
jgi:predicted nucleic acid-binding protein